MEEPGELDWQISEQKATPRRAAELKDEIILQVKSGRSELPVDLDVASQPHTGDQRTDVAGPMTRERRDELVIEHLGLVQAIARVVCRQLPVSVEFDDLVQAGRLGLIQAAADFDPARGVKFSLFAAYRIRGAIYDSLREWDYLSRHQRHLTKKVEHAASRLVAEGRQADSETLAAATGLSRDQIETARGWSHALRLHDTSEGEDDSGAPIVAVDPAPNPEELVQRSEQMRKVRTAMEELNPRWRALLVAFYWEDLTLREIGKRMENKSTGRTGVNETRACQIHGEAIRRLRTILAA